MDQDRFNKMMNILSLIYEKKNEPHTDFLLKIGDEVSELLEELEITAQRLLSPQQDASTSRFESRQAQRNS